MCRSNAHLETAFAFSKPSKVALIISELEYVIKGKTNDLREEVFCNYMLPFLRINCFLESVSELDTCGIKLSLKHLLFANNTRQEFFNI